MNDSTLLDMIPDYALDILSPEERAALDDLLARSDEARLLLHQYESTLDGLSLIVPMRQAPGHLTTDFAARLREEAKIPAGVASAIKTEASNSARMAAPATVSIRTPHRSSLWIGLGLAAAVILIALGAVTFFQGRQHQADQDRIASIMSSPTSQHQALTFTDRNSTAQVVVYMENTQASDMVVSMAAMPPLPAGKQYQLWLVDAQAPVGEGVYDAVAAQATVLLHLDRPIAAYKQVAISIEPVGGSAQPTTPPIAFAQIS